MKINDVDLFYKDKIKEGEGQSQFDKFYSKEDKAIVARHNDDKAASQTTALKHTQNVKTLQEALNSFSTESLTDKYGNNRLLHKSSLLNNIGNTRAAAVSQDQYDIKVEPATSGSINKVNDLNIVLKEMMLKSRFSHNIKKFIQASRLSTFSAMLIDFKRPEDPGKNEDVSQNRIEITHLDPNHILWDAAATSIEKSIYLYDLSKMDWFEIYNHPFIGKNKPLLDYVYEKIIKENIALKQDVPNASDGNRFTSVRRDNQNFSNITLYRKWVLKNKGLSDQECWVQYFIGEDIFLGQHKSHASMIPVIILKEFDEPNAFYGSSKVTQLLGKMKIYNELVRAQDLAALDNVNKLIAFAEEAGLDPLEIDYVLKNPQGSYIILGSQDNRPIQNLIASIDVNQLNPDSLAQRATMREEIILESGVSNLMVGDTNSMQTKSAMGRASIYTTVEMKATLENIKEAIYRACSIYVNYITNYAKTLSTDTEFEVKNYETNPKNKGKQPFEMVKINFKNLADVKVDIIPIVSLNPELSRGQELDILMQLANLKAQGLAEVDVSFLIEGLLKDLPFSDHMLRDIYVNKKENIEAIVDQISNQTMEYVSNQDDQRTPQQFVEDQGQATMDALSSPAGVNPVEAMQTNQIAQQQQPLQDQQGQGQIASPNQGIDNKAIL